MRFLNLTNLLIVWASVATSYALYLWLVANRGTRAMRRRAIITGEAENDDYQILKATVERMSLPEPVTGAFNNRIFPKLERLHAQAVDAKNWNRNTVILSVGIDFVITILAAAIGQYGLSQLNIAIIALTAFQAGLKAFHEHFQFQVVWITYKQTLDAAKSEIARFISGIDEYQSRPFAIAARDCLSQIEALFEASTQQVLSRHRQPNQSRQQTTDSPAMGIAGQKDPQFSKGSPRA